MNIELSMGCKICVWYSIICIILCIDSAIGQAIKDAKSEDYVIDWKDET